MNVFDRLVQQALRGHADLAPVQAVVEKELLHHDILREMNAAGLLSGLTFIGGTCLRACYGSPRLSEDLDFAGGAGFSRRTLRALADVLVRGLEGKYGLRVQVSEPVKESAGVDTWKLTMTTQPGRRDLPPQRIHIDICAVPSHNRRPALLLQPYGVDLGTSGLIIQVQSREEILADKLLALGFRPNRIKNRDLWDIVWLRQQGVELPTELIPRKIADHHRRRGEFVSNLQARLAALRAEASLRHSFAEEMTRFLPSRVAAETVSRPEFWTILVETVGAEVERAISPMTTDQ
jgi:predicted nucleotidyltransferase component of viral defense system